MRRIAAVVLLLLLPAGALAAQIPEGVEGAFRPHPEAKTAISRLYSPYCPGLMLETCPAVESQRLRDSIQALALEGWSAAELEEWMLGNHGEKYRAVPERAGRGLPAWLLPPGALLLGLIGVILALRRFTPVGRGPGNSDGSPTGEDENPVSPEVEARLREAIRDLEWAEDPTY
jgi:cytochrome c-type biogenesis protein CcmH/NrfF